MKIDAAKLEAGFKGLAATASLATVALMAGMMLAATPAPAVQRVDSHPATVSPAAEPPGVQGPPRDAELVRRVESLIAANQTRADAAVARIEAVLDAPSVATVFVQRAG